MVPLDQLVNQAVLVAKAKADQQVQLE